MLMHHYRHRAGGWVNGGMMQLLCSCKFRFSTMINTSLEISFIRHKIVKHIVKMSQPWPAYINKRYRHGSKSASKGGAQARYQNEEKSCNNRFL